MSSNTKKRSALGKGLGALLENSETDITSSSSAASGIVGSISTLPISSIEANPFNPRTNFEKEALLELSTSIKIHGIIQPLRSEEHTSELQSHNDIVCRLLL